MAPGISIREHIQWEGESASEPTTTIVLTSPGSRFVDLRIFKEPPEAERKISSPLDNSDLPFSKLDWAIAGSTHTAPLADGKGVHSIWRHWISSRTTAPDTVADEGDMFPVTGAPGLTLEKGSMPNPATGAMQAYEEIWRDGSPIATDGEGYKARFSVLEIHDDDRATRGRVVRLGQYVQALLRVGESFGLERWSWEQQKGWNRDSRMGELHMPCSTVMHGSSDLKHGTDVTFEELIWTVIEAGTL